MIEKLSINRLRKVSQSIFACSLFVFLSVVIVSCNKDELNLNDGKNRAVGSFISNSEDIEKFGNYEVVLELNKTVYSSSEEINFSLNFCNIGDEIIYFPSLYPVTQMITPPVVYVWSEEMTCTIDEINRELKVLEDIEIKPNMSLLLMDFDLNKVEGLIELSENDMESDNVKIGDHLKPGKYQASAKFAYQMYGGYTDTLSFEIK